MSELSAQARQGALLDATGHSVAQIVQVLGVGKTTVSRWRKDPKYQDEMERLRGNHVDAIEPVIREVKHKIAKVTIKALETLEDALSATHGDDSSPDYETRLAAAQQISSNFKTVVAPPGVDGAPGAASAPQTAVIVVGADVAAATGLDEAVRPTQLQEAPAAIAPAIDGSAVDVTGD